ncbi:MAG TPA: hypothetical protein VLL08_19095 [Kineosporiaceae bacterium]|nr:hypothetical protein [Kineosporiaceae bacterium]
MDGNGTERALRDVTELQRVLSAVLDHADPQAAGLAYRLVGTGAALAQGVHLPTGDVDILVARRADVDAFAAALSEFPCLTPPVYLPDAQQYFTRFTIDEIDVDFSTVERSARSDAFECIGRGPWEHYVPIRVGRHVVPAVSLELRLASELVRDRPDRYEPLIQHLRLHGVDLSLAQRAMTGRGVNALLHQQVLDRLRGK